jgi:hypothetical protein
MSKYLSPFRGSLVVLGAALALAPAGSAQAARSMISADGPGGTYELLGRSYGIEVPDCGHMVPHITEVMDEDLGKPVFVFHAHVNQDDDRCGKTDRQRTELRGRGGGVDGPQNSTRYYRWKFKLPTGFQTSGSFTHIFQIKAYGNGHGSGAPIMTLTPRNTTLAIDGRIGVHGSSSLAKYLGNWVVVEMKILHANAGRVEATIKNLKTGEMLLSYAGNHDMWDDGAGDGMPKFGIYRSLNQRGSLRDEQVRFADFCVSNASAAECADGASADPPPPPPRDGGAPPNADGGADPEPEPEPTPPRDAGAPRDSGDSTPDPKPTAGADAGSTTRPPTARPDAAPEDDDPNPDPNFDPPGGSKRATGGCSAGGAGSGAGVLGLGLAFLVLGLASRWRPVWRRLRGRRR